MSANFTGVTFPNQKVTPANDAVVRRAIFDDGILTGCDLSYSGSTLTMTAGQLMICGRQIIHPSSQNWAVTEATSGYARLVLTIDVTRTSTKDTFDQVVDEIQYATAANGFTDLTTADINAAGTRYQVAVCVVSLGPGGITGIVSKLDVTEGGGAGAGVNFKIVGGTTQPTDSRENTIWVNTDTAISSWVFSATEPTEPAAGMVWLQTGTYSNVEFNALKKGDIRVYPLAAKQYVSGAWVEKSALSYQDGNWVAWLRREILYEPGNENNPVTGGWTYTSKGYSFDASTPGTPTITRGISALTVQMPDVSGAIIHPANKIDLTEYSTIVFDGIVSGSTAYASLCNFCVWSEFGTYANLNRSAFTTIQRNVDGEVSLDVSELSGEFYVGFSLWTSAPKIEMRSMKLQK